MLEFLIDNLFVMFGPLVVDVFFTRQSAFLLVTLFLRGRLHTGASQETSKRSLPDPLISPRNIDDVLSLNNSKFGEFVDRIYPIKLEVKDTTGTTRSASYIDLHLEIDKPPPRGCAGVVYTHQVSPS